MKSGSVEFALPLPSDAAISDLKSKLARAEKRNPSEMAAIDKQDSAMTDALHTWRALTIGRNMRALLKIEDGAVFNSAELDLAGWVRTYAEQSNLAFSTALDRIFEFLKRSPKSLEWYTNGNACFAESADGVSGFSLPAGWNADQQSMETFRRARVYQAGNPATDLVHAVIEVNKGDQVVRSRITELEVENARQRAELAQRAKATGQR